MDKTLIFLKDIVELQAAYNKLVSSRLLSKKALCELCLPFRDKYKLTDRQTLDICRNNISLMGIIRIAEVLNE